METTAATAATSVNLSESHFDGTLLQLVFWSILGNLITFCTLGLCFPLSVCLIYNWEIKHTTIEGRRLCFTGKALGLWGNWLKWLLLTIVTLGIYGFWVNIKLKQWKTKHTHFAN